MKTRKLPYSLTKDGRASLRGEHLVPSLEMPRLNLFVGVKTGKKYEKGYLVYLGKDVTVDDIGEKLGLKLEQMSLGRPAIESFITALQRFKIGNVVSVSFPETDKCVLTKEAEHPPTKERKRKLP